uniref:Outer membrane protein assembly factor n=1 Tax=Siphoviridae sp. ct16C7 TaxID=2825304 RepID=A0A8S5NZF4_9CAUD|nr:MAG TPA: outer membrane protein assembly factor [Siphoviridae sp. ct16C7]
MRLSRRISSKPPRRVRNKGGKTMRDWLQQWMPSLLLAASLIVLALTLTGCATRSIVDCAEQKPLPKSLTAQTSPDAQLYSEKVQSFFLKVENWLSEVPPKQTP